MTIRKNTKRWWGGTFAALFCLWLGFVGYIALVVDLHMGFGLLPAVLVISVLTIPYITKSTETALAQEIGRAHV